MSEEVLFTLLLLLSIASGTWLAMVIKRKSKQRKIRRHMEHGIADYLAKARSDLVSGR